jgi:hypothetical protein
MRRPNGQMTNELAITADQTQMTPPPTEPRKQPTSAGTPISKTLKFSKKRLALAFAIAGHSGCWWLGRLLSWALLGRILNGTDEPH